MASEYNLLCPILFGCGAVNQLGEKVKEMGCKKLLFIYGHSVKKTGIGARLEKILDEAGIGYVVYNNVIPEPPSTVVNECGKFAEENGVDGVLCCGGGSAMDIAKGVAVYLSYGGPIEQYLTPVPQVMKPKIPMILVPTTAGTGTESTMVCVIINSDVGLKRAIFVQATYGIIDPELSVTAPASVTATSGFDALAHCVEAITARARNPFSEVLAAAALEKIAKSFQKAYDDPNDLEARSDMALASNWAGIAFSNTDIHVGHATCDSLSAAFETPHGLECAWVTPEVIKLVAPAVPREVRVIAKALGCEFTEDESIESVANKAAEKCHSFMRGMNIKSLKEMGFSRDAAVAVADILLNNQPHICANCPVPMNMDNAQKLLADVYDNYQ